METQVSKSPHPLAWVAGIAVILFSIAGIAAIMGWIPTSGGPAGNNAALEKLTGNNVEPAAPKVQAPVPQAANPVKHAAPKSRTAPGRVADSTSAAQSEQRYPEPVVSNAAAGRRCAECGVIESVREIQHKGEGTGLGAVGGAVVGGLLGNQVGSGRGNTAATVVGAVGGVLAGNEIEKRVKSTKGYEVTVRFDDGSSRVISAASASTWRTGDRVRVVDGMIRADS